MIKHRFFMKMIIFLLSIGIFVVGCSQINRYFGLKDDNIFEEIIEGQIENRVGLDIDLTPLTPEV